LNRFWRGTQIHGAGELGVIPGTIARLERWERHTGSGHHYSTGTICRPMRGVYHRRLLKELRKPCRKGFCVVDITLAAQFREHWSYQAAVVPERADNLSATRPA
jgi:hypothetical protein